MGAMSEAVEEAVAEAVASGPEEGGREEDSEPAQQFLLHIFSCSFASIFFRYILL
jgi:hypothetical protein